MIINLCILLSVITTTTYHIVALLPLFLQMEVEEEPKVKVTETKAAAEKRKITKTTDKPTKKTKKDRNSKC